MTKPNIEVIINEDSTVSIEVNGIIGPKCENYTNALVRALGGTVTSDNKKPEYYQKEGGRIKQKS